MKLHELIENRNGILDNLRARKSDLEDYGYLQAELWSRDVTEDTQYQCKFTQYYVVGVRDEGWRQVFFRILEREKNNSAISFGEVLRELYSTARYKGRQQVEASFSSKLVATIRPDSPVYDKYVRCNLGLKVQHLQNRNHPQYRRNPKERIRGWISEAYPELVRQTSEMTQDADFPTLRESFDATFPQHEHFTDVKKLDLFLWQYRP